MSRSLETALVIGLLAWIFIIPLFVYSSTAYVWITSIVFVFITISYALIIAQLVYMNRSRRFSMPSNMEVKMPMRSESSMYGEMIPDINPNGIKIDWSKVN